MPLASPWRRKQRPQRERLGHESPGIILRGPPIAVTCKCGEKRDLRYGEAVLPPHRQHLGRNLCRVPMPAAALAGPRRDRRLDRGYKMIAVGKEIARIVTGEHSSLLHPFRYERFASGDLHPSRTALIHWS